MPGLIPLILIIVPIIEITLFVQIGGAIGLGWTLLVILATAMLGARAIRRQGIDALARAQAQMATGKPPVGEIVHGVLILMAGILLLTPGFMTDALGFFAFSRNTAVCAGTGGRFHSAEIVFRLQRAAREHPKPRGCKNYRRRLSR